MVTPNGGNGLEVNIGYHGNVPPDSAAQIAALEAEIGRLRGVVTTSSVAVPAGPLKLNLGCGLHRMEGFVGVDIRKTEVAEVVCDLATERWPWADGSVDEVHCAHMFEHVPRLARLHFMNELYRVLKQGGKATIVTPHWASGRAYGDLTHEWPPVAPFFYAYLNKAWRAKNALHTEDAYKCDFDVTHGYTTNPAKCTGMNDERAKYAVENLIDCADDMIATLVKAVR